MYSTFGKAQISTVDVFYICLCSNNKDFRSICNKSGIILNVSFNYSNGENKYDYII